MSCFCRGQGVHKDVVWWVTILCSAVLARYSIGARWQGCMSEEPGGDYRPDRTGPAEWGFVSCVSECVLTLPSLPICLVD